jgi:DnaA family protein
VLDNILVMTQLTLGFKIRDEATFANFYAGNNQMVVEVLRGLAEDKNDERVVFLHGDVAVGKSHLLQACCHAFLKQEKKAIYIPLRDASSFSPEILTGLEHIDLICLDDIDALSGAVQMKEWYEALFHLYNRLETNTCLLISAGLPATQLNIQLADLQSRLSSGLALQLEGLNDQQLVLALQLRAHARGLKFPREVGEYLLRRCQRDMHALLKLLKEIDQASLALQRRLTIPFVRQVIEKK